MIRTTAPSSSTTPTTTITPNTTTSYIYGNELPIVCLFEGDSLDTLSTNLSSIAISTAVSTPTLMPTATKEHVDVNNLGPSTIHDWTW